MGLGPDSLHDHWEIAQDPFAYSEGVSVRQVQSG